MIAINTSFRRAPFADVLYACDLVWWRHHHTQVLAACSGERWTANRAAARQYRLNLVPTVPGYAVPDDVQSIGAGRNSGHQALGLSALFGAARVILLGYDMQRTGGRAHWHGDHPRGLNNLGSLNDWRNEIESLAAQLTARGLRIINATRESALRGIDRQPLESVLQ